MLGRYPYGPGLTFRNPPAKSGGRRSSRWRLKRGVVGSGKARHTATGTYKGFGAVLRFVIGHIA